MSKHNLTYQPNFHPRFFRLWPESQKLKKSFREGKFDTPPEIKTRFLEAKLSATQPGYWQLISQLKAREVAKEDELYKEETRRQPWYSKYFTSPDV